MIKVDEKRHEVILDGGFYDLPRGQFEILSKIVKADGRIVTREQLAGRKVNIRTIDQHISRIRSRFGRRRGVIKTIRGVGYKLARV